MINQIRLLYQFSLNLILSPISNGFLDLLDLLFVEIYEADFQLSSNNVSVTPVFDLTGLGQIIVKFNKTNLPVTNPYTRHANVNMTQKIIQGLSS